MEEVAKEPMEVPVVPRNLGLAGIDLAWAHTGIYRRIVGDARRSVSAQELVSRSARSLGVIRELRDELQEIQGALASLRPAPDDDYSPNNSDSSDSEDDIVGRPSGSKRKRATGGAGHREGPKRRKTG